MFPLESFVRVVIFSSSPIEWLETDGLIAGAVSRSVIGMNKVPSVSASSAAFRPFSGCCTDLSLGSTCLNVFEMMVWSIFCRMRLGYFVVAVSSGFDTWDHALRLSRLLNILSHHRLLASKMPS